MKSILILTLSLICLAANADTVDTITSIISIGNHTGQNANGDCSINVSEVDSSANAVLITATDASGEFSKLVENGTIYQSCSRRNCSGGKLFVQVDHINNNRDGSSYTEKILRTSLSGTHEGKLYVVVAERVVTNLDSKENKVECEVDLE